MIQHCILVLELIIKVYKIAEYRLGNWLQLTDRDKLLLR